MDEAAQRQTVRVHLGDRSYDIVIASRELSRMAAELTRWCDERQLSGGAGRTALVVTDRHVQQPHATEVLAGLHREGWTSRTVVLEPGEQTKSLQAASDLYDQLVDMKADRQTVIIAVGGGVVGDLAGFVASTYNRGLPFVQVPTTLLAQVDSSVGGKVGINHPRGKNLIGAFHQPLGVFIDTSVLTTLPDRDYRAGLAEVVKYGVILDAEFFAYLETHVAGIQAREATVLRHIVAESCRLKGVVVEQDEFERTGLRAVLNYGHTFAHAFEALGNYGELLHGEAVAIGMIYASRLAERLGRIEASLTDRQLSLWQQLQLPTKLPEGFRPSVEEVLGRMRLDKKNVGGQLRFVLPTRMGHVELVRNVPESMVCELLAEQLPR